MVLAQKEYDATYPDAARSRAGHEYNYSGRRLAISPALAERLSREIVSAANRVIDRCLKEELIDLDKADDLRELINVADPAAE